MDATTPRIVYIAGSAHGGSTLLDLLLGGHSATFGLGEVNYLHGRGSPRCSCGVDAHGDCPFWSAVDARLGDEHGLALDGLEVRGSDPERFGDHNRALVAAAAAVSGKRVLVDSSKSPRRLAALVSADIDVRPIHLVRSPFGVCYSYARRGGAVGKPARDYVREHRRIRETLRGRDHLVVRYEKLAERPEAEVARVMEWLGLAFEPAQMDFLAGERHNWGGNGLRFRGDTTIRRDDAWRTGLSRWQKAVVGLTTLGSR